jgi:quercetin dioxygenase-like cupin family protein
MSAIVSSLPAGVVRADEGERLGLLGHTLTFKSPGHETEGAAFIWEMQSSPGTFVPPHIHKVEDELIYVVEGEIEVTVGEQTHALGAGDLVKMPRGVPHAVQCTGTGPSKTLWTVVPAGKMESLFRELAALPADQPPDPEMIMRINHDHDIESLPPPEG